MHTHRPHTDTHTHCQTHTQTTHRHPQTLSHTQTTHRHPHTLSHIQTPTHMHTRCHAHTDHTQTPTHTSHTQTPTQMHTHWSRKTVSGFNAVVLISCLRLVTSVTDQDNQQEHSATLCRRFVYSAAASLSCATFLLLYVMRPAIHSFYGPFRFLLISVVMYLFPACISAVSKSHDTRADIVGSIGNISRKNCSDLRENFTTNVTLDKEVPIKFWKSSDPELGSVSRLRTPDLNQICLGWGLRFPNALVTAVLRRNVF